MWELAATVFVASVLGSVHCVGMCGPFVALTGLSVRPSLRSGAAGLGRTRKRRPLAPTAAYNLGRGVAYTLVGALAGTLGMAIDAGGMLAGIQRAATTVAGLTMIVIGALWLLDLLGAGRRLGGARTSVSNAIADRLRRGFASTRGLGPVPRSAALGVLTSFMPCGWLYAFAITAAGTGSPVRGAALMAVFWAGTVPILTLLGAGVHRLSPLLRRRLPVVMALLLVAVGTFTVVRRAAIVPPPEAADPTGTASDALAEQPPCHAS